MRTLTFLLHMLPPIVMAAACSRIQTETFEAIPPRKGAVALNFSGGKSSLIRSGECVMFAMDEDGKVVQKDSSICRKALLGQCPEWSMHAGKYRIWCIAGVGKTAAGKLWNCSDAGQIGNMAFSMNELRRDNPLSVLTIDGDDNFLSLDPGQTKSISLTGKYLPAKIQLRNVVNRTSWSTLPSYGPVPIKCVEAMLLNVPDSMTIAEGNSFALRNSTSSKVIDMNNDCTYRKGSGTIIPSGGQHEEDLTLFCFPNENGDETLILSVALRIADKYTRWYNIPIGKVQSGYEYSVSNLVIMKDGAATPFTLTPSEDFSARTETCLWKESEEGGLHGEKGSGNIQYCLSHKQVFLDFMPEKWSLDFGEVFGPASVSAVPSDMIVVTGAGKYWTLDALRDGYAKLELNDGLNNLTVPVCIGGSIKYRWTDCNGVTWNATKTLHTHQRCRLEIESHYGTLNADLSGSIFSSDAEPVLDNLVCSYPERGGGIALKDHFEDTVVVFPYTVKQWNLKDCQLLINQEEGIILAGKTLESTLIFPFDLSESYVKPEMVIDDPYNNCSKYPITISKKIVGNKFFVTASAGYQGNCSNLGINVFCKYGNQIEKVMTINKCSVLE